MSRAANPSQRKLCDCFCIIIYEKKEIPLKFEWALDAPRMMSFNAFPAIPLLITSLDYAQKSYRAREREVSDSWMTLYI